MTGIGFFIICIFSFVISVCDHVGARTAEKVAIGFFGIGLLLVVCGVTVWLLQVMP